MKNESKDLEKLNEYIIPDWEATKTNQFTDEEKEERIETRFILDEIYKDRTIILHNKPRRSFPEIALVVDLTQFPLIWCDTCADFVTYEATGHEKGYIYIKCDFCNEELLHLRGNH